MKIRDLYSYIAENSNPGDVLVFYDTTSSQFYTDANMAYNFETDISWKEMILAFRPDSEEGVILYRETVLEYLDELMNNQVSPRLKIQLMLYNQNCSRWCGYLTDNLWSHIVADGNGVFGLDNPFDYVENEGKTRLEILGLRREDGGGGGF